MSIRPGVSMHRVQDIACPRTIALRFTLYSLLFELVQVLYKLPLIKAVLFRPRKLWSYLLP